MESRWLDHMNIVREIRQTAKKVFRIKQRFRDLRRPPILVSLTVEVEVRALRLGPIGILVWRRPDLKPCQNDVTAETQLPSRLVRVSFRYVQVQMETKGSVQTGKWHGQTSGDWWERDGLFLQGSLRRLQQKICLRLSNHIVLLISEPRHMPALEIPCGIQSPP